MRVGRVGRGVARSRSASGATSAILAGRQLIVTDHDRTRTASMWIGSSLNARLVRSLEPDDGDELTSKEWEAAWATEIDRRMREVAEGGSRLDGDHVDAEIRAMLDASMP
jgi:hypothetical protein